MIQPLIYHCICNGTDLQVCNFEMPCSSLTDMETASELSQTVCLLAVPATMTCHDLLTFTAACHTDIQHVRVIRDGTPNQYMVLITFRTQVRDAFKLNHSDQN